MENKEFNVGDWVLLINSGYSSHKKGDVFQIERIDDNKIKTKPH